MRLSNKLIRNYTVFWNDAKSAFSISQLIEQPNDNLRDTPKNIYIHEDKKIQNLHPDSIFRLLISPNLSSTEMNLNINKLKANPLMNAIIQAQKNNKYQFDSPRVVVDSPIIPDPQADPEYPYALIKKNMMELQKLLINGLNLPISYLISNKSYDKQWLKMLAKKPKAIDSNVIQKGCKFAELIFDEGYLLNHIFLRNGKSINATKLEHYKQINIKQLAYVLNSISFQGKLILQTQFYEQNLAYLTKMLKQNGYKVYDAIQVADDKWYSVL